MAWNLGFVMKRSEFRVADSRDAPADLGCRVQGLGFRV